MKNKILASLAFLLPLLAAAQKKSMTLDGTLSGPYNGIIHLIIEHGNGNRDSLATTVSKSSFRFQFSAEPPVLVRIGVEKATHQQDLYLEKETNRISLAAPTGNAPLVVTEVEGSESEALKQQFESWQASLFQGPVSDEEKLQLYYQGLYSFVQRYAKQRVSAYFLGKADVLRYQQVKEISGLVHPSLRKTSEWAAVTALLNHLDRTVFKARGAAFHHVVLKDSEGKEYATAALEGRMVLIDFWASWCRPCRVANPALKELYLRNRDRNFEIVGISYDREPQQWLQAIEKDGLPWKQLIDPQGYLGELGRYYDIMYLPSNILIDKDGKIVGVDLTLKEVEKMVRRSQE